MSRLTLPADARVAVIAPAGRFAKDRLLAGCDTLRAWGYRPVFGPNLFAADRYHAGTPAERLDDFVWAATDPAIDAIWLARGGFGCAHLLPQLPWERLAARPLIGFSDATALHTALWQAGWTTAQGGALVHGPVVQTMAPAPPAGSTSPVLVDHETRAALREVLSGHAVPLPGRRLCGPPGRRDGPVVGGNLTVLASLCGTPWQLQGAGCIVVLEDVGEAPYRLDRLVTQLLQAGCLDGCAGLALGQFIDAQGTDADGLDYGPLDVLRDRLTPLGVPVLCDLPVGHGPRNLPWQVGRRGVLTDGGLLWAFGDE